MGKGEGSAVAETVLLVKDDVHQLVMALPLPVVFEALRRERALVLEQEWTLVGLQLFLPGKLHNGVGRAVGIAEFGVGGALPLVCLLLVIQNGLLLYL